MVDFAAIADRATVILGSADPAQFQTAYDAMILETTTQERAFIPVSELFEIILSERTEWEALTDGQRQIVRDVLSFNSEQGVPTQFSSNARAALIALLGTATKSAVAAAIPEDVPTWPDLTVGQVSDALRLRDAGDI